MITKNKISTKFKTTKLKRVNSDTKKTLLKNLLIKKNKVQKKRNKYLLIL